MNKLLIIDPQNDFCEVGNGKESPALPVQGAYADIKRIAGLIEFFDLKAITITLDSHPSVAIERPGFWRTRDGSDVSPFTVIGHEDLVKGEFVPRDPSLLNHCLDYTKRLEEADKYQLLIWPVHCVVGTWGHAMPLVLTEALYNWEVSKQTPVTKIMKGMNPLTEQYSAVKPEVSADPKKDYNYDLVASVDISSGGYLFIAGQASSHCVRATVMDLIPTIAKKDLQRVIILKDCMSPVSGFELQEKEFFSDCKTVGVKVMSTHEYFQMTIKA